MRLWKVINSQRNFVMFFCHRVSDIASIFLFYSRVESQSHNLPWLESETFSVHAKIEIFSLEMAFYFSQFELISIIKFSEHILQQSASELKPARNLQWNLIGLIFNTNVVHLRFSLSFCSCTLALYFINFLDVNIPAKTFIPWSG